MRGADCSVERVPFLWVLKSYAIGVESLLWHGDDMKKQKVYILTGDPIPLARARHGQRRVYDSQKPVKLIAGISLRNQHEGLPLFTQPLRLDAHFYFKIPMRLSGAKKDKLEGTPYASRPDLDNCIKFILDVSNMVLFEDDACVTCIIAHKLYGAEPRVEFTLTPL